MEAKFNNCVNGLSIEVRPNRGNDQEIFEYLGSKKMSATPVKDTFNNLIGVNIKFED